MKRYRGRIIFGLLCLAFLLGLFAVLRTESAPPARKTADISVVVYGADAERWRSLDQGISQACAELGIEKPILTLSQSGDAAQQLSVLQREIDNGAGGLLVAAAGGEAMAPEIARMAELVPVVLVESGVGDALPLISADNAEMGRLLASEMAGAGQSVVVIRPAAPRDSVQARFNGFMAQAGALGIQTEVWEVNAASRQDLNYLTSRLRLENPDMLAAFDNETLEALSNAISLSGRSIGVHGIGNSSGVVHALDLGSVSEICFQNEFSIGYLGLMRLAGQMSLDAPEITGQVEYRLVTRQNMYDAEIERLLFPIIQ